MTSFEQQKFIQARLQLFRESLRIPSPSPFDVARLARYMNEHVFEPPLSVSVALSKCGITYGCIHSHFKHFLGKTIHQYKTSLRIEASIHLMEFSELELAEIAFGVGYENYSTFRRAFKKSTGFTPSQFRKNAG